MAEIRELVLSSLALPSEEHPASLYLVGSEDLSFDLDESLIVGKQIDLGTWFNSAPIGWWARIFGTGTITLRVEGQGNLKVWGALKGERTLLSSVELVGQWSQSFDLLPGLDFIWVEISSPERAMLKSMEWSISREHAEVHPIPAKVTVVIPTYGLEEEALKQVRRLLAPDLREVVARVLVIDQGNSVADSPNFKDVRQEFGSKFELIAQGNFGGSGGYARGMIESLRFPDDAVLLLDDDAVIEPSSLRRALALSEALGRDKIIGTGLISAELPTQLTSLAEGINRRTFNWGPTDGVGDGQIISDRSPENWTFLSPNSPTEYSGWWGTLLPVGAVKRIGLPAPFFLKWDDAEYGLRAGKVGIGTVTVPGISAWHPTWAAKGTVSSWSSWPMHRNRLTVAAAYRAGRGVIWNSLIHQIKHVLSLQYTSAELWNRGIEEFLDSPEWLTAGLLTTRANAQEYIESIQRSDSQLSQHQVTQAKGTAIQTLRGVVGLFTPSHLGQVGRSKGIDYSWVNSIGMDGFVIERVGKVEELVREPKRARSILNRTFSNHYQLFKRWNTLRSTYGEFLPESTTKWGLILELGGKGA